MKTEGKYRLGLIELLKEKPLEDINVILLCDYVHSNRQTFYYHYRDISDVVENIFLKEKILSSHNISDFDGLLKTIIAYINSNYAFLSQIAKSYANEKLKDFFFTYFYKHISESLRSKKGTKTTNEMFIVNRYMSNVASNELTFWIMTKRKEKPSSLQKRLSVMWKYLLNQYPSDLKKELAK